MDGELIDLFPTPLWQASVEQFRSTTPQSGRRSCRKLGRCSSIAVTRCHRSLTMAFPSASPPTSGIPSGRGRYCLRPRTAPSTCGTGSTNQLAAADGPTVQFETWEEEDEWADVSSEVLLSGLMWIRKTTDNKTKTNLSLTNWFQLRLHF